MNAATMERRPRLPEGVWPMSCGEELKMASKAWSELKHAEREITRLNGYQKRSRAMREDLDRNYQILHRARATLNSVLKAVP